MIEVFKTNIHTEEQAELVISAINQLFGSYESNFDLEDQDRILRIESIENIVNVDQIIKAIKNKGFSAEVLE